MSEPNMDLSMSAQRDVPSTSESVNKNESSLPDRMNRMSLSIAAATALPSSSPVAPSNVFNENQPYGFTSSPSRTSKPPLRRAPSATSLGASERPSPPPLNKKTSLSSIKSMGSSTPPRSPALRRSSSYFHNLSMGERSSLPPPVVEEPPKPPVTAASVARDFFENELEVKHGSSETTKDARTVVILQDACYGHRYSRPRTSKSSLSTIVERPERIQASVLGVATAYVRLGRRHAGGAAAPHPRTDVVSLPSAPFKIQKTSRTLPLRSPAATIVHGAQWMDELTSMCERAESRLAVNGKELARTESKAADGQETSQKPTLHEGDLYLCSGSLAALEGSLGGVCAGVDAVFEERGAKRAFVCIRPPGHHCSADMPSGFCWLNNVHVGIGHAVMNHGLTHAAIIDFDLHHGDGSQSITWAHNSRVASLPKNTPISKKVPIGYFSLHDINSYPCEEGDDEKVRNASLCIENAHGQSIWNVHLQPWKTPADFWALYEERYMMILEKARAFLKSHSDKLRQAPTHPKPKGAIFLSAGFDASEWEGSGMQRHQVNVPTDFYARFTRDVISMAEDESLGVGGRIISVLEGGYSDRALTSGVLSHLSGLVSDAGPLPAVSQAKIESNIECGSSVSLNGVTGSNKTKSGLENVHNSEWWSPPALEELESVVNPTAQPVSAKGQRTKVQPTFTTPTESFIAKVNPVSQGRRSLSGSGNQNITPMTSAGRAPSPPPPEVGWATASHELAKLLIPSDRETRSCKPEELNAEATRKRRERQSNTGLPNEERPSEAKQMPIRETRNRGVKPAPEVDENRKAPSRASRRRTVADMNLLSEEAKVPPSANSGPMQPEKAPARRRSSVASSITSISTLNTEKASEFSGYSATDSTQSREPLMVKKTRIPTGARPEAPKPKPVKKSAVAAKPPPVKDTDPIINGQSSANGPAGIKDVDQLTAGMKTMSIKLNVPPREEYEARQAKAKPAPRGRPVKSTGPKTTKPRSPAKPRAKAIAQAAQTAQTDQAATGHTAGHTATNEVSMVEKTSQSKDIPTASSNVQQDLNSVKDSENTPLEPALPNGPNTSAPPSIPPTVDAMAVDRTPIDAPRPLTPKAENTSVFAPPPPAAMMKTSSPPSTPFTARRTMTKDDLPKFTSSSPIPFGKPNPNPNSNFRAIQPQPTEGAMSMKPDPQHPNAVPNDSKTTIPPAIGQHVPPAPPIHPQPQPQPQSQTQTQPDTRPPKASLPLSKSSSSFSIWDVPDTPQPPRPPPPQPRQSK